MTTTAQTRVQDSPDPLSPVDEYVDAAAAIFRWTSTAGKEYELQVARDASFADVAASIIAGSTDSVTLYELLPATGETMYWRVRGHSKDGAGAWSEVSSFVASTRNEAPRSAASAARGSATAAAPKPAATAGQTSTQRAAVPIPVAAQPATSTGRHRAGRGRDALDDTIDGTTSSGMAMTFALLLHASFILLLLILRALA